ncbi:MAG: hypothetical protein ACHQRJ_07145 [Alphaproteobacteria bacterium]
MKSTSELSFEEICENFDIDAYYAAKRVRRERPWVRDIIRALWGRRLGMQLQQLYRDVWGLRYPSGLKMPKEFEAALRSSLNHHTSQSTRWNGKPEDDLFYSPDGRGTWAIRHDIAAEWLKRHSLPPA